MMKSSPLSCNQHAKTHKTPPPAILLSALLVAIALFSVIWILAVGNQLLSGAGNGETLWADIYQNGELLDCINLNEVREPYTFIVVGDDNCTNEIAVQNGSIGIVQASCPDKLCVHQGFIHTSLLPITCLPNHLVIQIRMEKADAMAEPDILTY